MSWFGLPTDQHATEYGIWPRYGGRAVDPILPHRQAASQSADMELRAETDRGHAGATGRHGGEKRQVRNFTTKYDNSFVGNILVQLWRTELVHIALLCTTLNGR